MFRHVAEPLEVGPAFTIIRGFIVVLVIWQAAIWAFAPPPFMLPSPLRVAAVFFERPAFLAQHFAITLSEILIGLALGLVSGVSVALLVVALPRVGKLVWPFVLVLQALPVFAIAPLLVLWFGFGLASKVVMATLIIFFPIASAFADGLRRTDRDILDAAALTEVSAHQTLVHIRVPLALPSLLSGLRVAAALAPLGAVVGEWVGASGGLGFVMLQANARMQTETMFAALALIAGLTLILRYGVDELSRFIAPWAPETP